MELPLVEEIREARRLAEEARDAAVHVQRLHSNLASLSVLAGLRIPEGSEPELQLPGEEIVDMLVERWSQLADLHAGDPLPSAPMLVRVEVRKQQLLSSLRELQPLADTHEYQAHRLAHLQEEQRELLGDARYAELTAELHAIGVEREQHVRDIGPIRQRLGMVGPASSVLGAFEGRITAEIEQVRMVEDPLGISTWKAVSIAESLSRTAAETLASLGLEVPAPRAPRLTEGATREAVLAELDRIAGEFRGLLRALDAQRISLEAQEEQVSQLLDSLTKQLTDRMG